MERGRVWQRLQVMTPPPDMHAPMEPGLLPEVLRYHHGKYSSRKKRLQGWNLAKPGGYPQDRMPQPMRVRFHFVPCMECDSIDSQYQEEQGDYLGDNHTFGASCSRLRGFAGGNLDKIGGGQTRILRGSGGQKRGPPFGRYTVPLEPFAGRIHRSTDV